MIELPEILNLPPKLLPIITSFNKYRIALLEGGRGSAKTHSVARLILYICEKRRVRVLCGRETEASIEESVYTVFKDLIEGDNLNFTVQAYKIIHNETKSVIRFKGFRDQSGKGNVNAKGVEGSDILWIDEAQSISKPVLDTIIPTVIRKERVKIFFTMNRFMRDDPVWEYCQGRADVLHIPINYFENPFCSLAMKIEAEIQKNKSERDYKHIWLGQPLASADDYLFNVDKLYEAYARQPFGDLFKKQRILGIDFAAQGNDQCVATILDRKSSQHWKVTEQIPWDEPDAMVSTGKIINLIGMHKPDIAIIDIGGMGKPVYDRLIEAKMPIFPFDGGETQGVDTNHYANCRAEAYHILLDWFDQGFLCIDKETSPEVVKQLEKIKRVYRSNGVRVIQPKVDMKKELKYSPDNADSLMMAVYGAVKYLGRGVNSSAEGAAKDEHTRRINKARRR